MSRICGLLGKKPMFGHNVSHANNKTKRTFLPNVHWVRLESEVLGHPVSLKLSAHGMRTVHKHGGLDNFLSKVSCRKLQGDLLHLKREFAKRQKKVKVGAFATLNPETSAQ